ncbi:MAG: enoyl-CoA hydratase/isomerase family protein [Myxococcales bacterium]|nr:enoyl-CoA hydratase/isomerase family protein [Myxococcales bacterium]
MAFSSLQLTPQGDIMVVTLQRKTDNSMDLDTLQELIDCLNQLEEDKSVKAVVFTGQGEKYFSTGIDLEWFTQAGPEGVPVFVRKIAEMTHRTLTFPKPTIGAFNGHCFGLGAIWSCAFDFRFMRQDRGWFCFPEVDVNIPLSGGMRELVRGTLPFATCNRLLLTGQRVGGDEAVKMGIVEAAFAKEELLEKTLAFAQIVAAKEQSIYASLKHDLRHDVIAAYAKYLEETA